MCKNLKKLVLQKMFHVSKKPVLFRDLLEANAEFNEGMLVDPAKLNFKFRYGMSYMIFGIFILVILFPASALTHAFFTKIDVHISLLAMIVATSAVFIGFDCFKAWARKELTHELIKKAWENHFLYFPYEKYSQIVEQIYDEAVKNEIPKRDLEKYVLDKLVQK
ncbi:MAG: hypothetical protein J6M21_06075 [Campylobacter sp.]|nr:hypothetical protein [Campylobacter sp.]